MCCQGVGPGLCFWKLSLTPLGAHETVARRADGIWVNFWFKLRPLRGLTLTSLPASASTRARLPSPSWCCGLGVSNGLSVWGLTKRLVSHCPLCRFCKAALPATMSAMVCLVHVMLIATGAVTTTSEAGRPAPNTFTGCKDRRELNLGVAPKPCLVWLIPELIGSTNGLGRSPSQNQISCAKKTRLTASDPQAHRHGWRQRSGRVRMVSVQPVRWSG